MAGTFYGSNQTINGTNGPDTFAASGNGSQETFNGLDGSDSFDLGSQPGGDGQYTDTTVNGGLGNDTVSGVSPFSTEAGTGEATVEQAYSATVSAPC